MDDPRDEDERIVCPSCDGFGFDLDDPLFGPYIARRQAWDRQHSGWYGGPKLP